MLEYIGFGCIFFVSIIVVGAIIYAGKVLSQEEKKIND